MGDAGVELVLRQAVTSTFAGPSDPRRDRELLYDTLVHRVQGDEIDLRAADAELARLAARATAWVAEWAIRWAGADVHPGGG